MYMYMCMYVCGYVYIYISIDRACAISVHTYRCYIFARREVRSLMIFFLAHTVFGLEFRCFEVRVQDYWMFRRLASSDLGGAVCRFIMSYAVVIVCATFCLHRRHLSNLCRRTRRNMCSHVCFENVGGCAIYGIRHTIDRSGLFFLIAALFTTSRICIYNWVRWNANHFLKYTP